MTKLALVDSASPRHEAHQQAALELLRSREIFNRYLQAVRDLGLVGEERNAAVILVVGNSRLLEKPMSIFVKGRSSAGKNFLVDTCLRLFPQEDVHTISSSSAKAWNYSKDDLRHRIVYLKEKNTQSGVVHPLRLLISENKLVHQVVANRGRTRTVDRHVTRGPIAAISTTTQNQLEIDDETRNLSIWIDESEEQTKRIVRASVLADRSLPMGTLALWKTAHQLIAERAHTPITLPSWFSDVAEMVKASDVRARRYFPAFITACRSVALLCSFQDDESREGELENIDVTFRDYAIAALIFRSVLETSLLGRDNLDVETRTAVAEIASRKAAPVDAEELAQSLGITKGEAYGRLRTAERAGAIQRANKPEKANRKLYLPTFCSGLVPDPEEAFRKISKIGKRVRFRHPLTGSWIVYDRDPSHRSEFAGLPRK